MNNEVIKQLIERKSVRVFIDREITEETVGEILRCSVEAPTAGNQQLYSIIRVKDPELKVKLSEVCDHQPFIAEGKLILVYCADCLKWYEAFKENGCEPRDPGVGDLLLAVDDALIAAQNAVTAAWSLGIGSCYIGDIMENCEEVRSLLKLPEYVFPAALLVFGYPTEQQKERVKPERVDLKYIVSEDSYHRLTKEESRQMFLKKCSEETFGGWISAFCKRKYNSDFSKEMQRSVNEYIKQYGKEMSMLETLDELKIEYQILKHNPVNTIEEALKENIPGRIDGIECKSLFLKNKNNYYLYFLEGDRKADLQELASFLHEPKLRFAPEEDLQGILGLDSGSVTPLGVINDKDRMVTVVISGSLKDERVLVHPDSNDTTVSIRFGDLIRYIEFTKHVYLLV